MSGNGNSLPPGTRFLLDECLPGEIADALQMVGYPIISCEKAFGGKGRKDREDIVPYCSANHLVWITKDDAARSEHRKDIEDHGISVVWLRGILRERKKRDDAAPKLRMQDIHRMLVNKLDEIEATVSSADHPHYFVLYMRIDRKTEFKRFATLTEVSKWLERPGKRAMSLSHL